MKRFGSVEIKEFVSKANFDKEIILNKELSWPKISIVTPSYNQGEFLERTILSVLNQNYPNLEYIIIDGGSTDNSIEIIKKYEKYLAYWVSEKDHGQSDALNKGFARATGEIVGWQNSDDTYATDSFVTAVNTFKKYPKAEIVFGNTYMIDENDNIINELRFTPFSLLAHLYEGMSISNQTCFWKKAVFDKIGMIDTRFSFSMDFEFFLRAKRANINFKFIHQPLGSFRVHTDSKTANIFNIRHKEHQKIDEIYDINRNFEKIYKTASLIKRTFFYLIQGDLDYILKGLTKLFIKNAKYNLK